MRTMVVRHTVCTLTLLIISCSANRCPAPPPPTPAQEAKEVTMGPGQEKSSQSQASVAALADKSRTDMIIVDQIGYRTQSDKWFMIKNPQIGYDSETNYIPGPTVQLRKSSDDSVVKEITLTAWSGGKVDKTFSGDQVWQGEFSEVAAPGTYHIYDAKNDRESFDFEIGDELYKSVLEASVKSYFYQRSNFAITAEHGGKWTHSLDHEQQKSAHLYDQSKGGDQGEKTARDISGGWFDAGDFRKYTSWMGTIIWDLAYAYEWFPHAFSDATRISESGNGVPDILDEIKYELDWMLKMQRDDGALYSGCFVVNGITHKKSDGTGDPSGDDRPYFYSNISTSATSSGATAFAIGARHFSAYEEAYPGYSAKLKKAADDAWSFLKKNPKNIKYDHSNFENANANKEDSEDKRMRVLAAAELYRMSQDTEYHSYFEANYDHVDTTDREHQPIRGEMFETGHSLEIQRGLVSYCFAPDAKKNIVDRVKTALKNGIEWIITKKLDECPYKSFIYPYHYHWGSNAARGVWANTLIYGIALKVNPDKLDEYKKTAEEHLHYFHGRNATGYCYLTQCQLFGAEKPITQLYHVWFHDGTKYDTNPAPGFLAGGPNRFFKPAPSVGKLSPPQDQPPMKSYKDWNTSWPENSWEITENSTGYQSKHVLTTAAFVGK